jgi:type IV pilus assembly protein PilB
LASTTWLRWDGFEPHSLERFRNAIAMTSGMVLVTGPQGSGRTTTLYSAIASLNRPETNVVTVEDAVELDLPGINQVAINRAAGETTATVLRSLHDVDGDVVLVSAIGDAEAAKGAFELAQGGCLVLAALPTSDAPSAVAHLLSAGIDPYVLATTVHVIVAQRLVRRICTKCRVDVTAAVPSKTLIDLGFSPDIVGTFQLMKGRGCGACNGTGYRGSVGLFEVLQISEGIRELIATGGRPVQILRRGLEEGMLTLRMSGLEKIKNGVTTVEEVLREKALWPVAVAPPSIPMEPAHAMERAEGSRATPLPDSGLRVGSRSVPERAEGFENAGTPESLAAQLANARAEVEALRERVFELNSYRTAYERLLGDAPRPPLGNA